jgi:hypothetical protein
MKLVDISPAEPYEDLPTDGAHFNRRCRATGADFTEVALEFLEAAGATVEQRGGMVAEVQVGAIVRAADATRYVVLAHGTLDPGAQAGLKRSDTLKKAGWDAIMLARHSTLATLIVTSHLPTRGRCATHLSRLGADVVDVVATEGDLAGFQRLQALFGTAPHQRLAAAPPAWRTPNDQLQLFGADEGDQRA